MSRFASLLYACSLVFAAFAPALAQAPASAPVPEVGNTVLIASYQCDPADHAKVDQALREITTPVLNRMIAEGKLVSWGVLATYVGGPATRSIYVWAKDPIALLKARAEYLPEIMSKPGWAEIQHACPIQETSINNMIIRGQPAGK